MSSEFIVGVGVGVLLCICTIITVACVVVGDDR